jgi:transaldolase
MDEKRFRWEMNEDAMATEMLGAGIRGFARDLEKLRDIVRKKLN